jgi:hypothetical protein
VVCVTLRPRFTPGKRTHGIHCVGGWVDLRAALDTEARGKILYLRRGSNLVHSVCSQTLVPSERRYTCINLHDSRCDLNILYLLLDLPVQIISTRMILWITSVRRESLDGRDLYLVSRSHGTQSNARNRKTS